MSKVSKAIALKAKEAGFDEKCAKVYYGSKLMKSGKIYAGANPNNITPAPSLSHLRTWLETKKDIVINIVPDRDIQDLYHYVIYNGTRPINSSEEFFDNNSALTDAVEKSLELLG